MSQKSRLVYTTDGENTCDNCKKSLRKCQCSNLKSKGKTESVLNIYFEKTGRRGSGVTVVKGLILSKDELKKLTGNLKKYCGVGGSVKHNNQIELQGDQRQSVKTYLDRLGS